jgi:cell division protein FtsB
MIEFQKKKKIRKVLYSPITLLILAIVFVVILRSLWGVYTKEKLSYENLIREKTELEKLYSREKALASSLEYLNTDIGVENEIRSKFRAVKDGEKVVVIVDNDISSTTEISTTTEHGFFYNLFH